MVALNASDAVRELIVIKEVIPLKERNIAFFHSCLYIYAARGESWITTRCCGVHLTSALNRAKNGQERIISDLVRKICHATGARTMVLSRHTERITTPISERMLFSLMVLAGLMSIGSNELNYVWLVTIRFGGRSSERRSDPVLAPA